MLLFIILISILLMLYIGIALVTYPPKYYKEFAHYYKVFSNCAYVYSRERFLIAYIGQYSNEIVCLDLLERNIYIKNRLSIFRRDRYLNPIAFYWHLRYFSWAEKNIEFEDLPKLG